HEVVYFFFQAEDGIRDYKVTGVQTCALPISVQLSDQNAQQLAVVMGVLERQGVHGRFHRSLANRQGLVEHDATRSRDDELVADRSEERRVGKERRSRGSPYSRKIRHGAQASG